MSEWEPNQPPKHDIEPPFKPKTFKQIAKEQWADERARADMIFIFKFAGVCIFFGVVIGLLLGNWWF